MRERWLIISYFANIDGMAPSHHIDDRILALRERGIEISLLSSPCGPRYQGFSHMRVPSVAPSGVRYEIRYFLRRRAKKRFWFKFWETLLLLPVYPLYFIEKVLFRLDSTWSWVIASSLAAAALAVMKRPGIIYSTGGPVSAHIAAAVASRIARIPYIAEFQDPLVHQYAAPGRFERHFIEKVERLILKKADLSIFLTREAEKNAERRNRGAGRTATLYAGAVSPANPLSYTKGRTFTVSHFGSLGGSRNLEHFFDAVILLLREQPDLRDCFILDLYGNNSRNVCREIETFPYRELLRVHGKVEREHAVSSMHRADVLLLIQNTDDVSFETIPSKVYEYLLTGRPILALLFRNPELQEMLEGMGHVTVQADDPPAIKAGIETYLAKWREDRLLSCTESPFTVERATDELISLAHAITNAR